MLTVARVTFFCHIPKRLQFCTPGPYIATVSKFTKGMSGTFCTNRDFSKVKFVIKEHRKRESLQKLADSKFSTAESLQAQILLESVL